MTIETDRHIIAAYIEGIQRSALQLELFKAFAVSSTTRREHYENLVKELRKTIRGLLRQLPDGRVQSMLSDTDVEIRIAAQEVLGTRPPAPSPRPRRSR